MRPAALRSRQQLGFSYFPLIYESGGFGLLTRGPPLQTPSRDWCECPSSRHDRPQLPKRMSSTAIPLPNIGTSYDVEAEVGRGGMATVYRAFDRPHNRRVAEKVPDTETAASLGTTRFLPETTTAAGPGHPT